MGIRGALDQINEDGIYEIPYDDLVGQVLIPACSRSCAIHISSGYFTSESLAQIAPGLAAFINDTTGQVRLLLSPSLNAEDESAIREGTESPQSVIDRVSAQLLEGSALSPSAVVRHAAACLSFLLASGRLELRFVLMDAGMYHKKYWIFEDDDDVVVVHGSGNVTGRGLLVNGEQMAVERTWTGAPSKLRVRRLQETWQAEWQNQRERSITVEPLAALQVLKRMESRQAPTAEDFLRAWMEDDTAGLAGITIPSALRPLPRLRIPTGLEWQTGKYAHQGRAVEAFRNAEDRGVLAIATGGGKTRTSLIAATLIQDEFPGPFLLVVLVPTAPLVAQWANDIRSFGVEPQIPKTMTPAQRRPWVEEVAIRLSSGRKRTEVLLMTPELLLSDAAVMSLIESTPPSTKTMLIGDEMHGLGTDRFLASVPSRFDARLGLSATPVRQYDPDGTDRLFDYFGHSVFEFDLKEAIEAQCLVPYDYFIHVVELTEDEFDEYKHLTALLVRAGSFDKDDGRSADGNSRVEQLLRQRRAILEYASLKLDTLESILTDIGPANMARTLMYASAKAPPRGRSRQIEDLNRLLDKHHVVYHQFTSEESSNPRESQELLRRFGAGDYQTLTAMKVLDEGIDVPQTDTAFILASNTVRREWVQRRGRVLRTADGKTKATLHDFLVVPPDREDPVGKNLMRGEVERAEAFMALAANQWEPDGPRATLREWQL